MYLLFDKSMKLLSMISPKTIQQLSQSTQYFIILKIRTQNDTFNVIGIEPISSRLLNMCYILLAKLIIIVSVINRGQGVI